MEIIKWYRVERWCYLHHLVIVAKIIKILIRILWGAVIPYQVEIGEGTQFTYQALGVVLYRNTVIGSNCIIRQHVTIALGDDPSGIPTIGDNVDIGAGTVIWGGLRLVTMLELVPIHLLIKTSLVIALLLGHHASL